jgi:hypothetical protein
MIAARHARAGGGCGESTSRRARRGDGGGSARVRECESARVRECESARVRECGVRSAEGGCVDGLSAARVCCRAFARCGAVWNLPGAAVKRGWGRIARVAGSGRGGCRGATLRPLRSLRLAPPPKLLGEVGWGWDRYASKGVGLRPRAGPSLETAWGRENGTRCVEARAKCIPSPACGRGCGSQAAGEGSRGRRRMPPPRDRILPSPRVVCAGRGRGRGPPGAGPNQRNQSP